MFFIIDLTTALLSDFETVGVQLRVALVSSCVAFGELVSGKRVAYLNAKALKEKEAVISTG